MTRQSINRVSGIMPGYGQPHVKSRLNASAHSNPQASSGRVGAAVQKALAGERKRVSAIKDMGEKFGFPEAAERFAEEGKSVEEFGKFILNKSPEELQAAIAETSAHQAVESRNAVAKIKSRFKSRFGQ